MNYSALATKSFIFKNVVKKEEFICSWEVILMYIAEEGIRLLNLQWRKTCFQVPGCRPLQYQACDHS